MSGEELALCSKVVVTGREMRPGRRICHHDMSHDMSSALLSRGSAEGYHNLELLLFFATPRAHLDRSTTILRAHQEPMMDMFKNFKTFGKSKSRDENSKLTLGCSGLKLTCT